LSEQGPRRNQQARKITRPVVLFADDSSTQRALVRALLGGQYHVEVAADGDAALAAIRATRPDVILSDLRMPGLSGEELLHTVKADPELRRIPFILITAEAQAALRTMELGADDFLGKPYGPEELRVRVAAAIRSYRMYAELEAQHAELVEVHQESKRLEVELRQSQKLEAVGRLAAGIAHEINTPIQFIGDNTAFLSDAFESLMELLARQRSVLAGLAPPPEVLAGLARMEQELEVAYLLEQIPQTIARTKEGVQRVATIVRAMKEFAHPDQKDMVAIDLNRSLQATLEVARNEYKFVAEVETAFQELPPVTCYSGDINQVFLNVIVNAAHAIADQVKGTGAKGLIRVATSLAGEVVEVRISDTGGGIPEAMRQKIFEPFFTTKEVGRGTGQGLAIARSVVEKHHGSIDFETTVGQGTAFRIRLPVSGTAPDPARLGT
jgi:signal transduction histidine kinase